MSFFFQFLFIFLSVGVTLPVLESTFIFVYISFLFTFLFLSLLSLIMYIYSTYTHMKDDFETFLAKDSTGKPTNFKTAIHREYLYPKAQTVRSHRAIPPMSEAEKTGLRWTRQNTA
jgi:predicted membrane protein